LPIIQMATLLNRVAQLLPLGDTIRLPLPLLSVFALPYFTSYASPLNLAFFWLFWSTLLLSYTPLQIELYSALLIRTTCYLLPSALSLLFDTLLPSLAITLKEHKSRALPLNQPSGLPKLLRITALSTFNVALGLALQTSLEHLATETLHLRSTLLIAARLPLPWTILKHLSLALFLRGSLQYSIHRFILHPHTNPDPSSWSPAGLHKAYHHGIAAPFSLAANYDHPLTWILWRWIPLYTPLLVLRMHIITFNILLIVVSFEEAFTYSGYNVLPSAILLAGMARRADAHVLSGGKGNYGAWGVGDWVCGTSVTGDKGVQEVEERGIEDKIQRAVSEALEGNGMDKAAEEKDVGPRRSGRNASGSGNGNGSRDGAGKVVRRGRGRPKKVQQPADDEEEEPEEAEMEPEEEG
ncbi:hypothetical protein LTS18_006898, partial [Coniosporium uncinatum]